MNSEYFTKQFDGYTKYERARVIGARALQLSMGAPMLVKMSDADLEAVHYRVLKIAEREFEAGVVPLTIERPLPEIKELRQTIE